MTKKHTISRTIVVVIVALACIAVGGIATAAIMWNDPPEILGAKPVGGSAAVEMMQYSDPMTVSLNITKQDAQSLKSPTNGIVSSSKCKEDAQLKSGQSMFGVNGVPMIALATSVPMWRDIVAGNSGPDVVAMATELKRLGAFDGDVHAAANYVLFSAFKSFATKLGVPSSSIPANTIPMSSVMWIWSPTVTVASCAVSVASQVTMGQDMAALNTPLVSASISTDVSNATPGDRTLMVDGIEIAPVDKDGKITDPTALATLAAAPGIKAAAQSQDPSSLSMIQGQWTLTTPMDVASIPASSVHVDSNNMACVVGDGKPMNVNVVSSQLGSSYVVFDGNAPQKVSLNPPDNLTCEQGETK
jgi:hypothetical protein